MSKETLVRLHKETDLCCPKCKSDRIVNSFHQEHDADGSPYFVAAFTQKTYDYDSEHYQVHYDCQTCLNCGWLDFPGTFDIDYTEYPCECGETKMKVTMFDDWSAIIHFECSKCNKVYKGRASKAGYFIPKDNEEAEELAKELDKEHEKYLEKMNKQYDFED